MNEFHNQNNLNSIVIWSYVFESLFFIHMILQFFKEIKLGYTSKPIRRVHLIAKHYLKNEFIWDLIPLIPLQLIKLKNNRVRLFFLIKIYRLKKGFKLFDVQKILKSFK